MKENIYNEIQELINENLNEYKNEPKKFNYQKRILLNDLLKKLSSYYFSLINDSNVLKEIKIEQKETEFIPERENNPNETFDEIQKEETKKVDENKEIKTIEEETNSELENNLDNSQENTSLTPKTEELEDLELISEIEDLDLGDPLSDDE